MLIGMVMPRTTNPGEARGIKSVGRTFDIVECIHERGGAGVTEIADEVGLTKGTVHCHLNTLRERRYLVKDGDTYRVGLQFLGLGGKRATDQKLYRFGKPEAEELVRETGETVQIGVEEHGKGIYIYQSRSEKAVRTDSYIGTERHLHATSFGKAILAHLPERRVTEIIDRHGLPPITDRTTTNREVLFEELETIRDRGVAFDDGEQIAGIRCVAAPVLGPDDEVLGAFSLTGPTTRMSGDRFRQEIPELLKRVTRVVEINVANS